MLIKRLIQAPLNSFEAVLESLDTRRDGLASIDGTSARGQLVSQFGDTCGHSIGLLLRRSIHHAGTTRRFGKNALYSPGNSALRSLSDRRNGAGGILEQLDVLGDLLAAGLTAANEPPRTFRNSSAANSRRERARHACHPLRHRPTAALPCNPRSPGTSCAADSLDTRPCSEKTSDRLRHWGSGRLKQLPSGHRPSGTGHTRRHVLDDPLSCIARFRDSGAGHDVVQRGVDRPEAETFLLSRDKLANFRRSHIVISVQPCVGHACDCVRGHAGER
ncbi:hypothetical protein D3C87_1224490 [compost metagenome]